MRMLRFFALAVALTAFVAGCATTTDTTMDTSSSPYASPSAYPGASKALGPTSVPGSLEAP